MNNSGKFEQIIVANFTAAEEDEMTIRVFRDPATWEATRVKSLATSLYRDAIVTAINSARSTGR